MPADEKIVADMQAHIDHLASLKEYLDQLYLANTFAKFMDRPKLSLIITGVVFVSSNLSSMLTNYKARP